MSALGLPVVKPINDTTFNYSISDSSVTDLLGKSKTGMVYGFQHCKYTQVTEGLENHKDVQRVYDCSLGNDYDGIDGPKQRRLDGSTIHKVDSGIDELNRNGKKFETQDCNRKCKSGLTNQVLENYRRTTLEGKEISPIVFCIDYENETSGETNPYPLTSENLLSKTKKIQVSRAVTVDMNRVVTHSEIRRAYKLCHDPKVDPQIRAIAQKTFKFVKVKETRQELIIDRGLATVDKEIRVNYSLEEIAAPWEAKDFDSELEKRMKFSATQIKTPKTVDWKAELNAEAGKVDKAVSDASWEAKKQVVKQGAKYIATALVGAAIYAGVQSARSYFGV